MQIYRLEGWFWYDGGKLPIDVEIDGHEDPIVRLISERLQKQMDRDGADPAMVG